MKKLIFVLVACLFVSGCGSNQVVCSTSETEDGNKVTVDIIATIEKNNVSKVLTKMSYDFKDEKTASEYCKLLKDSKSVKCSGKKVTIEEEIKQDKSQKMTKTNFIKSAKKEGFKCK